MGEKYYKTVVTFEVLSNWPLEAMSLADYDYEITGGGSSGKITSTVCTELTRAEMAKALIEQGSDPEFLISEDDIPDVDLPKVCAGDWVYDELYEEWRQVQSVAENTGILFLTDGGMIGRNEVNKIRLASEGAGFC